MKVIGPASHAVLDYMTAGTFFALGYALSRRHRRASQLAYFNGAGVLALSLLTDYPGGVFRKISFRTHGTIDAIQAGMSALGPMLLGFAGQPEAKPFYTQAGVEVGAIAATDWNAPAGRLERALDPATTGTGW